MLEKLSQSDGAILTVGAAPPGVVSSAVVLGYTVADWIVIGTAVYTAIAIVYGAAKLYYYLKEKWYGGK